MKPRQSGVSLIELVISLAIVALLSSLVIPVVEVNVQRAKEGQLRENLRAIRLAIDAYKKESDAGRIAKRAGSSGYPPSLRSLVDGVTDMHDPKGGKIYFMRRIPSDPMQEDASSQSSPEQGWALRSYASPATSPQSGLDVFDIASRSRAIALDGSPYAQW